MKTGLKTGAQGELSWVVDPSMTITLGGRSEATVFSTPFMIMLMERAAREALRPFLEPTEESVGTKVDVEHIGPASLGSVVRGIASVSTIDDRKIGFQVQAFCGDKEIGRGHHQRAVIQLSRFVDHLSKAPPASPAAAQWLASSPALTPSASSAAMNLLPKPAPEQDANHRELRSWQTLQVKVANQVATVHLNRPKSLNAVNALMTQELEQLVEYLAHHPEQVRVVILTGAGDAFCAGDDVIEVGTLSLDQARELSWRQAKVYLAFEQLPQPIIAAVNGLALGGGCVAAYSCDLRVASHASRFGMPEITLGWPPGYGVAQLTALVGKARALELCLLGEPISASTALEWGLVHEVVPSAYVLKRAKEMANRILELPAEAIRETKRLVHADEGSLPKVTFRADTEAYIRCLALPDAREAITAFGQKRPPRFTGK